MKTKYRFHLLGLAHLPCTKTYMSCAFTQKNHKLARMLLSLGHEVIYYGAEGSDVPCTQFVQTHSLKDIRDDYGDGDNRFEIGYDWTKGDFRHDINTERKSSTVKFYAASIMEINANKKPDDYLLCTQGQYHKPIADAVNLFLTCESGIGYRGSVPQWFRAFESSYIQNYSYGVENGYACANGSYYDRVIPNYFDPNDVAFSDTKDNYYLFIGRLIKRKGIMTAYLATKAIGAKLIIAGQGGFIDSDGSLYDKNPTEFRIPHDSDWEYVGYADVKKRKKLMSKAIAVFTPTEYLECFAGTHVEAMLSGTPVITTNFGVFPGTIPDNLQGKVGWRCNTLNDFVKAALEATLFGNSNYLQIKRYASRFLMDNVKYEYQNWFEDLYHVYLSAQDPSQKGWSYLPTEQNNC